MKYKNESNKLTLEEKQKILKYRMAERRVHKRCKYCKYREDIRTITYALDDSVDYVFKCPWKEKVMTTQWNLLGYQGCFCRFYEPKELTIDEI